MGYSGPFRPGTGLAGLCVTATANAGTQVNVQGVANFTGGGGTARIVNLNAFPVWMCFYNNAAAGGVAPTLTFPVPGTPQPTQASLPAGQCIFVLVPPAVSGSASFPAYIDGVANCDSFSLISVTGATVNLYIQKGEGTGPG
jgi:hypothetical protein